jgi:flagellar basal body-associated protein FliL
MGMKWITIIIFTLITVTVWVGMEVMFILLHKNEVEKDYQYYTTPVTPGLNEETIDTLKEREEEYIVIQRGELE